MTNLKCYILFTCLVAAKLCYGSTTIKSDFYTRFDHITQNDGLPNNHITCLLQDKERYVWIGTRNGLARYDGHDIKVYLSNESDTTCIPSNYITALLTDYGGNMWVGTKQGLSRYNRKEQIFETVPLLFKTGQGLSHAYVRTIAQADSMYLWVETVDGNLHKMHTSTFQSSLYPHQRLTQEYYDYHDIFPDSRGNIWVGGRNFGPLKLDTAKNTFATIKTSKSDSTRKRDKDVACFFEDNEHNFWVSATDGFYLYNRSKDRFTKKLATSTYDIIEDKDKMLWLATGGGIFRFNLKANEFTRYAHNQSDPLSLVQNHVNCLLLDADNNIWAGTREGISILNRNKNKIKHYRHIPSVPSSLSHNEVTAFYELNDTTHFVGTDGGGLNKFNQKNEAFLHYQTSNSSISSNRIKTIEGKGDILWIGLWQGVGFNSMNAHTGKFQRYALSPNTFKLDWYNDLWFDGNKTLWCGVWGSSGIHFFDTEKNTFLKKILKPLNHPDNNPLYKQTLNHSMLICSGWGGIIYMIDTLTKKVIAYQSDEYGSTRNHFELKNGSFPIVGSINNAYSKHGTTYLLSDKSLITFTLKDKSFKTINVKPRSFNAITADCDHNNYWIGSSLGLEFFNDQEQRLYPVRKRNADKHLSGKEIRSLCLQNNTTLLIGTNKGLLTYNTLTNTFEDFSSHINRSALATEPVESIIKQNDKIIFLLKQGFIVANLQLNQLRHFNLSNSFKKGLSTNLIYDAIVKNDMLLLGTDRGLMKYTYADSSFHSTDKLEQYSIFDMDMAENKLLMSTSKGYMEYCLKNDSLDLYNTPTPEMLTSHLVSFVQPDSKGNIWVGTTNRGVNKVNANNHVIAHYFKENKSGYKGQDALCFIETSQNELYVGGEKPNLYNPEHDCFIKPAFNDLIPQEPVLGILEDKFSRLWIITAAELTVIDKSRTKTIDINPHFLNENLTFTGAALKKNDNTFLIGTKQGYIHFDPDIINSVHPEKPIRITGLTVMGKEIKAKEQHTFNYDENFVSFQFSSMLFTNNQKYQYQLKGVDEQWISTPNNKARYTKLAPGKYEFKVKLFNKPSTLSSFVIKIRPPFWESTLFYLLTISVAILLMLFWWRQRLKKLHILENNLNLKQRLLLSQLNPHFIFNALIAIQSYIYKNEPKAAGNYLSKFAKLMRLFLNNMRTEFTSIEDEVQALSFYLDMQKLRFNNLFEFDIRTVNVSDPQNYMLPSMILQPLLENAVEHGISHQDKSGSIELQIEQMQGHWHVTLSDNGKGIKHINPIKNGFKKQSISTSIIRERIEGFNKKSKRKYSIEFIDLKDNNPNEHGTKIIIKLPIHIKKNEN